MNRIRKVIDHAVKEIGLDIGGTTVLQLEVNRITPRIYGVQVRYFDKFEDARVDVAIRVRFSNDFSKCETAGTRRSATAT